MPFNKSKLDLLVASTQRLDMLLNNNKAEFKLNTEELKKRCSNLEQKHDNFTKIIKNKGSNLKRLEGSIMALNQQIYDQNIYMRKLKEQINDLQNKLAKEKAIYADNIKPQNRIDKILSTVFRQSSSIALFILCFNILISCILCNIFCYKNL